MDLVGPLEPTKNRCSYILVVIDYATRYPEAVPLRNITASTVAEELVKIFARVGLPEEILTDQGTNFTSNLMKELCRLFRVRALRTSVYHPQTDGLAERFNRTLKGMLKKFAQEDPSGWDRALPALMFAVREVPQASTGFSPFELLYGRQPRGILDVVREAWEDQVTQTTGSVPYILKLRERLQRVGEFAKQNLLDAQERQAQYYNRRARLRVFQPGDRVLLLLPEQSSKLLARCQGPFEIVCRVGEVNYEVRMPGRRKTTNIYHVNLLKEWRVQEGLVGLEGERVAKFQVGGELTEAQQEEIKQRVITS
uniref:Integrase catalytic domain-containing protein n=1 Tax=Pelodiscus sinensis TaxID=13735 RepID=K7EX21_PELSI